MTIFRSEPFNFGPMVGRKSRALQKELREVGILHARLNPDNNTNLYLPNYSLADETVTDLNAGLIFQRAGSDEKYTFADAMVYLDLINESRRSDGWRLPTVIEALSIVENLANDFPLLDKNGWSRVQSIIWTADRFGSEYVVVDYFKAIHILVPSTATAFIRAVRNL